MHHHVDGGFHFPPSPSYHHHHPASRFFRRRCGNARNDFLTTRLKSAGSWLRNVGEARVHHPSSASVSSCAYRWPYAERVPCYLCPDYYSVTRQTGYCLPSRCRRSTFASARPSRESLDGNGLDCDQALTLQKTRPPNPRRMNFFSRGSGSKTKQPPDLVRALKDAVLRLESAQTGPEQKRKVSPDKAS